MQIAIQSEPCIISFIFPCSRSSEPGAEGVISSSAPSSHAHRAFRGLDTHFLSFEGVCSVQGGVQNPGLFDSAVSPTGVLFVLCGCPGK